ncbi:DUF222 domain-containing protein [Mycolicibacterium peregrinum]|uniref:HNH endonuclease signature motif containing protein n=1 Tax=Mycolicibacterium peregrinum TaxID=43304 RepID=UPI003AADBAF9
MYVRFMEAGAIQAVAGLRAAYDAFAACDLASLTRAELVGVLDEYEALLCQLPSVGHRLLAQLQAGSTAQELGAKTWNEVLRLRWRLSTTEAARRLGEAAELGPRRTLTGEPLPPQLPVVAAAQGAGLLTADHVKVLRDAVHRLPGFVDQVTREQFEADLVRVAVGVGPKELKDTAELRLFLLDQDGPEPDDTERARTRGITMSKQGRDAMTPVTANLTPEAAAVMEVLFAKFAAPGMCNPDDEQPCTSGTPSQAQIDNDHRSLAQRQHDALIVIGRIALMTDLGQLNGLPVSIIVRTTLQDLESRAGIGISGGGAKLPIKDVIRMGSHASHYLAVFDQATGAALNYFRARRIASPAQRIMLIARDGGCTKPGCTVGAYGCQAHHGEADWAAGGNTNVDVMALACGPDNRLVDDDGGYTTTLTADGVVQWHPPPELDHGQNRINYLHRPELLLTPTQSEPAPADLTPDPTWEWERGAGPRQQSQPDPNTTQDPDPDWDLKPDAEFEPDAAWDFDWNTDWDSTFCQADLPSFEHLWDPEPCALEAVEPEIPLGWPLLDHPDPWERIGTDRAAGGKVVRGP